MNKNRFIQTVIFFVLCTIMMFSSVNSSAEQINIEQINFELGVSSLEQKDYNQAIKYFELVLKKNPKNIEARYNMALAFKKLGLTERYILEFDKTVELLNSPDNYQAKGVDIGKLRDENKVLHDNELASDKYALYSKVKSRENDYIDLGDMHYDGLEYETAIEYYNLALQINPYNDFTYYKTAKCYIDRKDYINAEPYITRAVQLMPQNEKYIYYKDTVVKNIDEQYLQSATLREKVLDSLEEGKDHLQGFDIPKKYRDEPKVSYQNTPEPFLEEKDNFDILDRHAGDEKDESLTNKIKLFFGKKAESENYNTDKKTVVAEKEPEFQQGHNSYFAQGRSQELDYLDLGDLHYDNREFETAIEYYNLSLNINENNDYTYYKIARCRLDLKNYNVAENYINKALALSPGNKKYEYFKNKISVSLENTVIQRIANENENAGYYYPQENTDDGGQLKEGLERIPEEPEVFYNYDKGIYETYKVNLPDDLIKKSARQKDGKIKMFFGKIKQYSASVKLPFGRKKKLEKSEELIASAEETSPYIYGKDSDYYNIYEPEETGSTERFPEYIYERPMTSEDPQTTLTDKYTPAYYNTKGVEYFKRDNLKKAEDFFKKAVELKPMYAKAYNNLSNIEVRRNRPDNAILYSLKAIEIDPTYPEPYYNLAMIYKKKRDFPSEISYLDQAVHADPKFYKAYFARGLSYYIAGNYERAKYNFKEVLKLKNDHYLASQNLGIIYANELNKEEAVNYLKIAVKLNKHNPASYYYLAAIYRSSGDIFDAMENYRKTIELDPVNYKAYMALSRTYEQNGETGRAIDTINEAIEINPSNAEPYNVRGLLYLQKDKYIDAAKSFKKAVLLNKKRAVYRYNLSQSYICLNMKKKARQQFEAAVSITPANVQDYIDLSEIFLDRKMPSYAVKVLRDGIMTIQGNDYLYAVLSEFYEKTGALNSAAKVLSEYLEKKPNGTLSLLMKRKLSIINSAKTNNNNDYSDYYDY